MTSGKANFGEDATAISAVSVMGLWRKLTPVHFVAAIGIGIVEVVFLGLTYSVVSVASAEILVDYSALFAAMTACVTLNRASNRGGAWVLLAVAYVFLFLMILHHSQGREVIIGQIMGHCLMLAVFLADRDMPFGPSGRVAYIIAAVAGIAAGALIWAAVLKFGPNLFTDDTWEVEAASPFFFALHPVYVAATWLLFAGPAVLFYGERQLAARTLQRLRDAELERVRRSREMIESELHAAQARVEPRFVFNTLEHIRRSCRRDPAFAERMLDELVSFLRAAMLRLRETSSTLAQEAELARAYLGILGMRLGSRLKCEIDVSGAAAHASVPSMFLLPLIDHVVTLGLHSHFDEIRLRTAAVIENGHVNIRVVNAVGGSVEVVDTSAIEVLRDRVRVLYGERGSLGVGATPDGGMEAVLEIPYERAARYLPDEGCRY